MSKGGSGGAKSGSGPSKGSGSGSKTATPERKAGSSKAPASARAAPGGKKTLGGKGSEQLDEAGIEFLKNLKGVDWGEQHDEVEPSQAEVEEGIKKQLEQEEGTKPDVDLSLDLVIKTNVADDQHLIQAPPGVREDFFRSLTHLHLDRCRIASLSFEVLSQLPSATHLYLQHNRIERVGNLGVMRGLQFLALSHNNIAQLEGLFPLTHLMFLDLSHNKLSHPQRSQLPESIRILKVDGNPFLLVPDGGSAVLDEIIEGLPNLRDLDVEEFEEDPRKDMELSSGQPGVSGADAVATHIEGALELLEGVERSAMHRSSRQVEMKLRTSCDRLSTVRASTDAAPRPSSSYSESSSLLASATACATSARGGSARLPPSSSGRTSPAPASRPFSGGSPSRSLSRNNSLGRANEASTTLRAQSPVGGGRPPSGGSGSRGQTEVLRRPLTKEEVEKAVAEDIKMLEQRLGDIFEPGAGPALLQGGGQGLMQTQLQSMRFAAKERSKEAKDNEDSLAHDIASLKLAAGVSDLVKEMKKNGAKLHAPRKYSANKNGRAPPPHTTQPAAPLHPTHKLQPTGQLPPSHASPGGAATTGQLAPVHAPPGQTAAAVMAAVAAADAFAARSGVSLADFRSPLARLERIPSPGLGGAKDAAGGASGRSGSAGRGPPLGGGRSPAPTASGGARTTPDRGRPAAFGQLPPTKPLFGSYEASDDSDESDNDDVAEAAVSLKSSLPPNPFS